MIEREIILQRKGEPGHIRIKTNALEDVDLTPYIVSQALSLTTEVTASRPDEDTVVEARFVVDVTATVQGVKNQVN